MKDRYSIEDMILLHNGAVTKEYIRFIHYVDRLQKILFDEDFIVDIIGGDEDGF